MDVTPTMDALDFIDIARPQIAPPDTAAPGDAAPSWRIARRMRRAHGDGLDKPGVVWLGGFNSDMLGAKACFLDDWAKERGRALLRFDYSGHGESGGRFEDGAIGDWLEQSVAVFERSTLGPQILVGASMGAWIALLLARRLAETGASNRLRGLVLLAPAVDFTQELLWNNLPDTARRHIEKRGVWRWPSRYSPQPIPITRRLVEEGRAHLLLGGVVRSHAPVHILQGMDDPDVPWRHALVLVERLCADPVVLTFIRDGDHRLSREADLALLASAVEGVGEAPGK